MQKYEYKVQCTKSTGDLIQWKKEIEQRKHFVDNM